MWCWVENEQGLSLIELLVATVIIVIALIGFSFFLAKGFGVVDNLGSDRLALVFAEGRLERLIGDGLATPPPASWLTVILDNRDTGNNLEGEYIWTVTPDPNTAPDGRLITLTLYYPPDPAELKQDHQKEVRFARIYVP